MIKSIRIRNLLSFGPDTPEFEARPLNVLIGPNGAGKSNLIEILGLLHEAPSDLRRPITAGGGIGAWIWKGPDPGEHKGPSVRSRNRIGQVEAVVGQRTSDRDLRYTLEIGQPSRAIGQMEIVSESVATAKPFGNYINPYIYYEANGARALINPAGGSEPRRLKSEDIDLNQSVLSQRKDPEQYPEITFLGKYFEGIRLYRDWSTGINSEPRRVQELDEQSDYLEEDTSNLTLVINRLLRDAAAREDLGRNLRDFYQGAKEIATLLQEGAVSLQLLEAGGFTTPGARLSDGTLRWLSLLSILLNPRSQSAIAIEEPELGLHPDIMRTLAKMLREASKRTQVFVTTHSEALVDALSDEPEAVVVCEKQESATSLRRLSESELQAWLEKYSLGDLWRKGEIGGTRW